MTATLTIASEESIARLRKAKPATADDGYRPGLDDVEVHPAANIFPMMSEAELQELADDIKANGQGDPVVFYKGQLLDGRNRWRACRLAGVEPDTCEIEDDDGFRIDPIGFVLSHNLHRRHLTTAQRTMIAARVKSAEQTLAKERQRMGKENLPDPSSAGQSRDKAAKAMKVSGRSVDKAAKILTSGAPELIRLVEDGEVSINAAAIVAELPTEEQRQVAKMGGKIVSIRARDRANRQRARKSCEAVDRKQIRKPVSEAPDRELSRADHAKIQALDVLHELRDRYENFTSRFDWWYRAANETVQAGGDSSRLHRTMEIANAWSTVLHEIESRVDDVSGASAGAAK